MKCDSLCSGKSSSSWSFTLIGGGMGMIDAELRVLELLSNQTELDADATRKRVEWDQTRQTNRLGEYMQRMHGKGWNAEKALANEKKCENDFDAARRRAHINRRELDRLMRELHAHAAVA